MGVEFDAGVDCSGEAAGVVTVLVGVDGVSVVVVAGALADKAVR